MKQRWLLAASLVLFVALTHISRASGASSGDMTELGRLLTHIKNLLDKIRDKRGCQGYMCGYSHMSGHAGSLAMQNAIQKIAMECAVNPNCSPRGRRRRAVTSHGSHIRSLRSLLRQGAQAS
ncbi:hypothetical protein BsWGS_08317 [Bradybaena similaris]